jgi:hypothetical protein
MHSSEAFGGVRAKREAAQKIVLQAGNFAAEQVLMFLVDGAQGEPRGRSLPWHWPTSSSAAKG